MAMCKLLSPQQEDNGRVPHMLCTLVYGHSTQHRTESQQVAASKLYMGEPRYRDLLENRRLGVWTRWCRLAIAFFKQTLQGSADTQRSVCWRPHGQRKREAQKRERKRSEARTRECFSFPTADWERVHALEGNGFEQFHANQCEPQQPLPDCAVGCWAARDGCGTQAGLSRPWESPGGRASPPRQSGQGGFPPWFEEPTSGGEAHGSCQKTAQGGQRPEESPSHDVASTRDRGHQNVGIPTRRLSSTPGNSDGASNQSTSRNHLHQQGDSSAWCRWTEYISTADPGSRNSRDSRCSRRKCQPGGREIAHSTADRLEGLCKLTRSCSGNSVDRSGDQVRWRRERGGRTTQKASQIVRAIWWAAIVSAGRGCGVQTNPKHEATGLLAQGVVVEAYHPLSSTGGAACDTQGAFSDLLLPGLHSIWTEPAFLHPFRAASNACSLRWEVLRDLSHDDPALVAPKRFISTCTGYPSCISQGPHSKRQKSLVPSVRFEDRIDVLMGCDDSWNLTRISVQQDALSNWPLKPWSKNCAC